MRKSRKFVFDSDSDEEIEPLSQADLDAINDNSEEEAESFNHQNLHNSLLKNDEDEETENLKWFLPSVRQVCTPEKIKEEPAEPPKLNDQKQPKPSKCLESRKRKRSIKIAAKNKRIKTLSKILFD